MKEDVSDIADDGVVADGVDGVLVDGGIGDVNGLLDGFTEVFPDQDVESGIGVDGVAAMVAAEGFVGDLLGVKEEVPGLDVGFHGFADIAAGLGDFVDGDGASARATHREHTALWGRRERGGGVSARASHGAWCTNGTFLHFFCSFLTF